jgi:hypothetical protein
MTALGSLLPRLLASSQLLMAGICVIYSVVGNACRWAVRSSPAQRGIPPRQIAL